MIWNQIKVGIMSDVFFEMVDRIQDVITIVAIPLFTITMYLILVKLNKLEKELIKWKGL